MRTASGCGKDTDCKGERTCEHGVCVAAEPAASSAEAGADIEEALSTPASVNLVDAGQDRRWFRGGPGHAGASAATGPVESPTMLWEVDLGGVVFSTPALGLGREGALTAYVGTHAGYLYGVVVEGERAGVLDLELELGGRIWGTAAVAGEGEGLRVYVGNDDDHLYAVAPFAPEGEQIAWKLRLGNCEQTRSPGPEGARCDVDGGPTLGPAGEIYVGADGLYKISRAGEVIWHWPGPSTAERPKHVFGAPVLTEHGELFFGGQDGKVSSLRAEDGSVRWQYEIRADVDGAAVVGDDDTIYIGADDGRVHALRRDGSLKWSFVAQRDIRSAMGIAPDGTVYATSFDGKLYALAPSGEVRWVLGTGGPIQSSPVVDAAGTVFFGSQDQHLYAVTAEGDVAWSIAMPGDVDSSIVLSESGTLVVGCDDGKLRAYRGAAGSPAATDASP